MILGGRDEGALREVRDHRRRARPAGPARAAAGGAAAAPTRRTGKFTRRGQRLRGLPQAVGVLAGRPRAQLPRRQLHKLCRDNFLVVPPHARVGGHPRAARPRDAGAATSRPTTQPASGEQIHRALLPGLLSKIGMWNPEARVYIGARQTRFLIHPSSGLARKPPPWVMAAELVETSQLFARIGREDRSGVAREGRRAAVQAQPRRSALGAEAGPGHGASEQVTLYGLPIVKDRKVRVRAASTRRCAASCSSPTRSSATSTRPRAAFMEHNRALLDDVQRLRDKARRSDMLADEYALCDVLRQAHPRRASYSGKTFEDVAPRRRGAGPGAPRPVARGPPARRGPRAVARALPRPAHGARRRRCRSRTGSTRARTTTASPSPCPLALLPQLDPDGAGVDDPGLARRTSSSRCSSRCPRPLRKALAPLDELAGELAARLRPFDGPMLPALERAIHERTGERVAPRRVGSARAARRTCALVVPRRRRARQGPSATAAISASSSARSASARSSCGPRAPRERHERTGLKAWDFDALPRLGHARRRWPHAARLPCARRHRDRGRRAPARVARRRRRPPRARACAGCSCCS